MVYNAKDPIFFCGDLHGNFHWLKPYFERYNISDCSVVFCGDVGLGFKKYDDWFKWIYSLKLRSFLRNRKIDCYFVRGNHDNPAWFDDKTLVTSCFKAVSDYSVISTPSHSVLCIGGGISIDRSERKLQMDFALSQYVKFHPHVSRKEAAKLITQTYWPDEVPVFDGKALDNLTFRIDTICSHAAPTFLFPDSNPPRKWCEVDKDLAEDCVKERMVLNQVYAKLLENQHSVRNWFYGHYHYYNTCRYQGVTGHLLDMARNGNLCIKELR